MLHHGGVHAVGEIPLEGCILDDGDDQFLVIAQISLIRLIVHALDHLQVGAAEGFPRPQERGHHGVLGMGVDDRARLAMLVGQHEERGALALLQAPDLRRQLQILAGDVLHKQILRLHSLLLDARWCYVDLIARGMMVNTYV